jgi:hypothetical protein
MIDGLKPDIGVADFVPIRIGVEIVHSCLRILNNLARFAAAITARLDDKGKESAFE